MLLLNQRNSIGNEFVHYLQERIYQLTIPEDIRDSLFQNLNKLSTNYILDSDDDTYVDSFSDIDSNEDDSYDDLENILLDQLEMEHDIDAFHSSEENQDEE